MSDMGFAIVGTGFIAGVIAKAIAEADGARLAVVSSRRQESADEFAAEHGGVGVVGVEALLARDEVQAVYVATPTSAKEAIALAAIEAGKHVLVDKPFVDAASVERMVAAAERADRLFMDATHFSHHPRTHAIRAATDARIGTPKSLHTAFYFPFSERDNIRFDTAREPMGALGDMAWYSMRAVVEYLQPGGDVSCVSAVADYDAETGSVTRASGLIGFASGESSTFDVGYTAGTVIMDLALYGSSGIVTLDDFVLDWANSFAFSDAHSETGYVHRTGAATRADFDFVALPSDKAQQVLMIENFARLAADGYAASPAGATLATQRCLDALWSALQGS